jgi:hypothetical protein
MKNENYIKQKYINNRKTKNKCGSSARPHPHWPSPPQSQPPTPQQLSDLIYPELAADVVASSGSAC